MSMEIDQATIKSMALGRVYNYQSSIVSIDFSDDGDYLVAATADGNVYVYNALDSEEQRHLLCKEYGVGKIRYTHHTNALIHTSNNKYDDSIRYWSIFNNTYLRYYQGHTDRVVSIEVNPTNDTFISAGLDNSVRHWDLRDAKCQGILRWKPTTPHLPCVAYDPAGIVFGVTFPGGVIKLFDVRKSTLGPFSQLQLPDDSMADLSCLKFSHNGDTLLASSLQGSLAVLGSLEGQIKHILSGFKNEHRSVLEPSFSADGKFILCGSENGSIHCWNLENGTELQTWESIHPGPIRCLQWNPVNVMFASGCSNLGMWIRDLDKMETSP